MRWADEVTNKEVFRRVGETPSLIQHQKQEKRWIGHVLRSENLLRKVMERQFEGKRTKGRTIMLLSNLKDRRSFEHLKRAGQQGED